MRSRRSHLSRAEGPPQWALGCVAKETGVWGSLLPPQAALPLRVHATGTSLRPHQLGAIFRKFRRFFCSSYVKVRTCCVEPICCGAPVIRSFPPHETSRVAANRQHD